MRESATSRLTQAPEGRRKNLTAQYPAAIDTWQDKVDLVDWYHAQYVNELNDLIIAVETTLGINPQGPYDTLAQHLSILHM